MPAHVTVLSPFLPAGRLTPDVLEELTGLVSRHRAFEVTFARFGRFPNALWLAPEPPQPLRALTEAIAAHWPGTPPHGGRFEEVIPHLTVASDRSTQVYDAIEETLASTLPFTARITGLHLMVTDGANWGDRARFALG